MKTRTKILLIGTGLAVGVAVGSCVAYAQMKKKEEENDHFDGQDHSSTNVAYFGYYSGQAKNVTVAQNENDIVMTGFGKRLIHFDYDPKLADSEKKVREVRDEEGKVIAFYKYIDQNHYRLILAETYDVIHEGKEWKVSSEDKEVANLYFVEDSKLLEGRMDLDLSDTAKLCILALPALAI